MVKKSRSTIMGLTHLNNKVKRNAFDLSHRHMFTSQIGELLPVFYQWCHPNETFKLSYSGFSRTAPLNTAAFTRLRENIQYFFVPFQSLWRYFEQTVNNMTTGQAGQNISMIANSPTEPQSLSTSLPYINLNDLKTLLKNCYLKAVSVVTEYYSTLSSPSDATTDGFYNYVSSKGSPDHPYTLIFNEVFSNREYRYVAIGKLLNAFGYGNFSTVITHDLFASSFEFVKGKTSFVKSDFLASPYALKFDSSFTNAPNLSVLPLVAYHKIVNDFYRFTQWQPYESWTSNLDFIKPDSSMNFNTYFTSFDWADNTRTIFDLEFSNLSFDYFNAVLPRPQFGDESAVPIGAPDGTSKFTNLNFDAYTPADSNLVYNGNEKVMKAVISPNSIESLTSGSITISGSTSELKISSLRSALALQKYKEIQNANDPDFESQVLAHFGIKPTCDMHKSRFISGADSTISINPQINSNFASGSMPDIKAIGQSSLSCEAHFTSDTYGIIIGIYRCTPQLDYAHVGIDRNLYKTDASDFPLPELDSIGMQTQYRSEVAMPDINHTYNSVDLSRTYGYASRYCELKTSYDRFDGGFFGAFSDWVTGFDLRFLERWSNSYSSLSQDVSSLFICQPNMLYPIFVNQWSGTANDDKILVGSVNGCVAVRPYSVHGFPYSN
jgi:hypothetical protein